MAELGELLQSPRIVAELEDLDGNRLGRAVGRRPRAFVDLAETALGHKVRGAEPNRLVELGESREGEIGGEAGQSD